MKHVVELDPPLTEAEKLARAYYLKGREEGKQRKRFTRPVWLRYGWWVLARKCLKSIGHHQVDTFEYDGSFEYFIKR